MKRRDFLSTSVGLAGATLLPALARGADPCPPPVLSVGSGASVNTSCGPPAAPGAAPAWFTGLAEKTWTKIATGTGQRLVDVSPSPSLTIDGRTLDSLITSWTGGCVDQNRGEFVMAANGGHAAYAGNECYVCKVRTDTPRWYRLNDPTPAASVLFDPPTSGVAQNADGRMRTVHNWHRMCFANGKVWHPSQDAYYSPTNSVQGVWSFDRDSFGDDPRAWPVAWANNPGPWRSYGVVSSSGAFLGGPSAFDRVSGLIWSFGEQNPNTYPYWSVDTRTGASRVYTGSAPFTHFGSQWAVVAHDLRILMVSDYASTNIWVLNLDSPASGLVPRPSAGGQSNIYGFGGVYHKPSKAVLTYDPMKSSGGVIRKLQIPTTSSGAYDPNGTFVWSSVAAASGSTTPATERSDYQGTYSKFNIIEDMGNGQSCLVLVTGVASYTYAYRLPVAGV